jgi:hypothetical protein
LRRPYNSQEFAVIDLVIVFGRRQRFGIVSNWMLLTVHVFLMKNGSHCIERSIGFDLKWLGHIGNEEYRFVQIGHFEDFKGHMLFCVPDPGLRLFQKYVEPLTFISVVNDQCIDSRSYRNQGNISIVRQFSEGANQLFQIVSKDPSRFFHS